jgi:hypothetical protein
MAAPPGGQFPSMISQPSAPAYGAQGMMKKSNLEKFSIYSNKLFHNFHLYESSFTCPWLQASGLRLRL